MTDLLKPCPLCGQEAGTYDREGDAPHPNYRHEAGCWKCYLWVSAPSPEIAAAKWNTRHLPAIPDPAGAREKVREALAEAHAHTTSWACLPNHADHEAWKKAHPGVVKKLEEALASLTPAGKDVTK